MAWQRPRRRACGNEPIGGICLDNRWQSLSKCGNAAHMILPTFLPLEILPDKPGCEWTSCSESSQNMPQVLRWSWSPTADSSRIFLVAALPLEQLERWHPHFLINQSRLIPECSITVVRLEEGTIP